MTKYTVFINKHSGAIEKHGLENLRNDIKEALAPDLKECLFLPPAEMEEVLSSYTPEEDVVPLIGGGDGTILAAVKHFKDKDQLFGILPLGTMNCVARDLTMPLDPLVVAAAYRQPKEIRIDVATANGEYFICNAMFGLPTDLSREREDNRHQESFLNWLSFIGSTVEKLEKTMPHLYHISSEDQSDDVRMKAGLISNNLYDPSINLGHPFHKNTLQGGELGVYAIDPRGLAESVQLLSSLSIGAWNEQSGLSMFATQKVDVTIESKVMEVLLDGENRELETPVSFNIQPKSLRLLIPA